MPRNDVRAASALGSDADAPKNGASSYIALVAVLGGCVRPPAKDVEQN